MPSVITLWDTGPLVALIDRRDSNHLACASALVDPQGKAVTTEAVVTEAHYLLRHVQHGPALLLELLEGWKIEVLCPSFEGRVRQAELMAKYADLPMDYGDATLVALGEELMTRRIFTLDSDFLVYRLKGRDAFELVP